MEKMELTDARQIEIFHTLEKIERLTKAIAFHKAVEKRDELALEQYNQVKMELPQHLLKLLEEMDVKLELAA